MSLAIKFDFRFSTQPICSVETNTDVSDAGHFTPNYDHFSYKLNVTICQDGTICPFPNNQTCCNAGGGKPDINFHNAAFLPTAVNDLVSYYELAGTAVPTTSKNPVVNNPGSSSPAVTPHTSTLSQSPSNSTNLSSCHSPTPSTLHSGLGDSAKIGLGIGIGVGASLVLHLFLFFRRRRLRRRKKAKQPPPQRWRTLAGEMNGESLPTEVDGRSRRIPELPE